jgi:hypothetical protein
MRKDRSGFTLATLPLITFDRCALETRRYLAACASVMTEVCGIGRIIAFTRRLGRRLDGVLWQDDRTTEVPGVVCGVTSFINDFGITESNLLFLKRVCFRQEGLTDSASPRPVSVPAHENWPGDRRPAACRPAIRLVTVYSERLKGQVPFFSVQCGRGKN